MEIISICTSPRVSSKSDIVCRKRTQTFECPLTGRIIAIVGILGTSSGGYVSQFFSINIIETIETIGA
jgi:hypothetical protein